MSIQQIILMVAPSLAGVSATTIISIILGRFIKKKLKAKIDEVGENAEFKKINSKIDRLQGDMNEIRGRRR